MKFTFQSHHIIKGKINCLHFIKCILIFSYKQGFIQLLLKAPRCLGPMNIISVFDYRGSPNRNNPVKQQCQKNSLIHVFLIKVFMIN